MKWVCIFFFNFYLFFIIFPINIFAQEFKPTTSIFNSYLDGMWEIGKVSDEYQFSDSLEGYKKEINFSSTETSTGDFLVNNSLKIDFLIDQKQPDFLFTFSYSCSTSENVTGFDQPFLIIFSGNKLIFKESNLSKCIKEQDESFLLPNNKEELILFFGEMGDMENETIVEIRDIGIFVKDKVKEAVIIPTPTKSHTTAREINYPTSYSPTIQTVNNWNEKKPLKGEVLGETTEKNEKNFLSNLPEYFPFLVGFLVFIFSFPLFTLLSFLLSRFNSRKEKTNE